MHPTLKSHDKLCFPLRRAYLLLLSSTLIQESWWFSPFLFTPFPLASTLCWSDPDVYIHLDVGFHKVLLLTIIYMIRKLEGETLSPYLSLCSMDAICSKNMLWVVAIMEDYMIVEYVGFAKSKLLHRPFLKIRWIAIVWWLRARFVSFQESLWSILWHVNSLLLDHEKFYEIICCYDI